jgi:hypothetical protein
VQSGFVIVGGVCTIAAVLIPLLIRHTMPPEVIEGVSKAKA